MKEHVKARVIAKKSFKVVKTGLGAILGGVVGGVVGLTQGMVKGVSSGIKGDFVSAVTDVINK